VLSCSSYQEGTRQAERPSGPQSLAALPTRLRLATTLRELCKWNMQNVACVSTFTSRGVFIGQWGRSTDLAEVVTHQMAAGRPLSTFSTVIAFPFLCRHVSKKPRAKPTQKLAGRPLDLAGQPPPKLIS
jgi:hypothetical protein